MRACALFNHAVRPFVTDAAWQRTIQCSVVPVRLEVLKHTVESVRAQPHATHAKCNQAQPEALCAAVQRCRAVCAAVQRCVQCVEQCSAVCSSAAVQSSVCSSAAVQSGVCSSAAVQRCRALKSTAAEYSPLENGNCILCLRLGPCCRHNGFAMQGIVVQVGVTQLQPPLSYSRLISHGLSLLAISCLVQSIVKFSGFQTLPFF